MRRDWYYVDINEMEALENMHQEVKNENIKAFYSVDLILQWKWNYLYGDEIPCTSLSGKERLTSFKSRVDNYYKGKVDQNCVIGLFKIYDGFNAFTDSSYIPNQVAVKYFIVKDAENKLIDSARVYFN